jgi:hypothetical protein
VLFAVYTSEPRNDDHKPRGNYRRAHGRPRRARTHHQRRTPRRRPDSVTVRRRSPEGRSAPHECHPIPHQAASIDQRIPNPRCR